MGRYLPDINKIHQEPRRPSPLVRKVRRKSDGKIFSSPFGAALGENGQGVSFDGWSGGRGGGRWGYDSYQSVGPVPQLSAANIAHNCDGLIARAFNGEVYEWVESPNRGLAEEDFILGDDTNLEERLEEWRRQRDHWLKLVKGVYYEPMRMLFESEEDLTIPKTAAYLMYLINNAMQDAGRFPLFPPGTSSSGLSRHILAFQDIYEPWMGLEIGETRVKGTHKPIKTYAFLEKGSDKYDPNFDIEDAYENPIRKVHKGNKPIIRFWARPLTDGLTLSSPQKFVSLKETYRKVEVSMDRVTACCEGDVYLVISKGRYLTFKYLLEVEEYCNIHNISPSALDRSHLDRIDTMFTTGELHD